MIREVQVWSLNNIHSDEFQMVSLLGIVFPVNIFTNICLLSCRPARWLAGDGDQHQPRTFTDDGYRIKI
jgi:hypothetical protein